MDLCFICKETLSEGELRLVKERGVKTLLASSISLKNIENQRLLKGVNEIYNVKGSMAQQATWTPVETGTTRFSMYIEGEGLLRSRTYPCELR